MKYGFIGAGNLASSVIDGMVSSGQYQKADIVVFDTSESVKTAYREKGFSVAENAETLENSCDFIFLTVKPYIYPKVLPQLKTISESLRRWCGQCRTRRQRFRRL